MQSETFSNREQAELKILQWPNNSPQEVQKTLRWRPHNVFRYFQSHHGPQTRKPRGAIIAPLSKFFHEGGGGEREISCFNVI